jgi:hypothetical protein
VRPKQLRIDGELADWGGAHFVHVGDSDAGRGEVALGYSADGLYVAARIFDDVFVRSARPSAAEDALVLRLALPSSGSWQTSELWLFAGKIGESPASAQLMAAGSKRLSPLGAGVSIVEGPEAGGYALEAFVPWARLGAEVARDSTWRLARGLARLHDVDRAGVPGHEVPATAATLSGERLPWLLIDGGPIEALRSLIERKDLGGSVTRLDWVGDVRDDAQPEHVVVIGTHLVLSGLGSDFTYLELPVTRAVDVHEAQMQDLTGDGKPELILRLHSRNELDERDTWQVFDLLSATPRAMFAVETRVTTRSGSVAAVLTVGAAAAGQAAPISVRVGEVRGLSADNFTEVPAAHQVPIPVPWGPWLERVYAWDGQQFAIQRERASAAPPATKPTARSSDVASAPAANAAASVAALIAAYRAERGVPPGAVPRFEQRVNMAGDARPESLALFGNECVVVGEGFRAGSSFFYFGLPVHDGADVLRLYTGDLTGDGRHELFARTRQVVGAVTREILYVYTFVGEQLEPLLAVEVSRSQGSQSIANQVSLVPRAGGGALQITPGLARGWSAADYPFSSESHDGVAPLLLPWKDRPLRYEYDGHQLLPRVTK